MKSTVAFLALLIAYSQAVSYEALIEGQWQNFKLEHGKVYESESEEQYRLGIYMENLHKIAEHNKLYQQGLSSYYMAVNSFSDLTEDEFLRFHTVDLSKITNLTSEGVWGTDMDDISIDAPPVNEEDGVRGAEVDWRGRGYVTQVRNQGQCGSCWSFSAAGALEGQWFKAKGQLVPLSEQNLMDCSYSYGNHGCNGGWMPSAFKYIIHNGGIDTYDSYPYEGRVGSCRYSRWKIGAKASRLVYVPQGEGQLKAYVGSVGPIAIAMQVIGSFQSYGGGVYDDSRCGNSLNHAMVAVGYGSESGKDYWLVKNSWGTGWGEQGYVKMVRNKGNQCGIASAASYPVV